MKNLKFLLVLFSLQVSFSQAPIIGLNFEANNMSARTPMDNDVAVSNDNYILSVDNMAFEYYTTNGDFLKRHLHTEFYSLRGTPSISLSEVTFDPRCIYDRYNDRFIIVLLTANNNNTGSKLLISFSKTNRPDSTYWHYEFPVTHFYPTTPTPYWLDYPNIAVNKDELFISLNTLDTSRNFVNNLILQIDKEDGYNGTSLDKRSFTNIRTVRDSLASSIVPVQHALQDTSYNDTMYFVSTNRGVNSVFNYEYNWWQLNSTLNDPASGLIKKVTPAGFNYNYIPYFSQPGAGLEYRIRYSDCRILSAYFQNNRILFAFHRSELDGDGISTLARINVLNNTSVHDDLQVPESTNLCYPSIATYSYNPSEYKSLMAYQKVGASANDYVSLWVVALDENRNWSLKEEVRSGLGLVNVNRYPTLERLGDYIKIQPKYNATNGECWMAGSYAFGSTPNNWGDTNTYNAYIARIFPPYTVSIEDIQLANKTILNNSYLIYPNPTNSILNVQSKTGLETPFYYSIFDLTGKLILQGTSTSQIDVNELQNGFYQLQLKNDKQSLEAYKIIKY